MRKESNKTLIEKRRALGYDDVMSPAEVAAIISKANNIDYLGLDGSAWSCLFAIFWAFGKRISEVVELRTSDIAVRGNTLAITFTVRKKVRKSRKGKPIPESKRKTPPRRTKRLTLKNTYAQIIKDYWESVKDRQVYMFPREHTRTGHIYEKYVWDVVKMMDLPQPVWSHLFRHSLATELASNGISAWELKDWFDWESIATADEYVSAAGQTTPKITRRKW